MADGDCGLIQGSSSDEVIMPTYARTKTWAITTANFFKRFFSERGGTYLDVGANIGLTTLPIAQNERVRCVAFEPDPTNFSHLSENVRRNSKNNNIELHQLAVMDHHGSVNFGLNLYGNPGDHRVSVPTSSRVTIQVEGVALDEFFGELLGPVAVKIDTQGAEPFVIEGGKGILSRAGALVLEYCPYMMSELNGSPETVLELLRGFGRIAVVPGEDVTKLEFDDPARVTERLGRFFNEAKRKERRYLDVYAIR